MIRRPPRSTQSRSSAASDVYKRQVRKVFNDANLDLAVDGAIAAKFRFGGQVCIAPNRFMVQEGVFPEFVARMAERMRSLRVGDGLDPRTNMGPLINLAARDKVGYVSIVRTSFSGGWVFVACEGLNTEHLDL